MEKSQLNRRIKKKKKQQEGIKLALNLDAFVGSVEEDQDAGCEHPWCFHLSICKTQKLMLSIKIWWFKYLNVRSQAGSDTKWHLVDVGSHVGFSV